jgi:ubiquitin carboxyl-terminal hydrolase 10
VSDCLQDDFSTLICCRILFMREFPVIDSAESFEQLRLRLKPAEIEQYGDSFIPEYVYQVIRQLPRFRDMRRGHQQDAQEFLGFLLEELHEECAQVMRGGSSVNSGTSTPTERSSSIAESADQDSGWMEVGHKQKPAITRSSGAIATESPVTKIFGGKLRSEWKVPGNKNSVTLEPYQPLQLDIGSPQVNNIVDALKGLTRPESMQGDFNSSRGNKVTATKQVFIETLPPVLILHLKRFQYDNATKRTEKIWKKVGYPLELEMPREVFPPSVRNKLAVHGGLPKYQLTGVIYHHGKNASGGHYTVDVRRQDGKEWIRLDDTLIRRVRSEDVAEGGSEEDPKVLAAALERHNQRSAGHGGNMFEQIEDGEDEAEKGDESNAWSQVNGHSRNRPSMAAVAGVNGGESTPTSKSGPQTPRDRYAGKDNKVAYLLFYRCVAS